MDEIAPEYDVVVLGTGEFTLPTHKTRSDARGCRFDGMCVIWVSLPWLQAI